MAAPQASSRLELLQARFQQKQLQEKEQKLLQLYDQQQQRAYQVVQRGNASSNHATITQHTVTKTSSSSSSSHATSTSQGGKVRQMFDERRQTTVKGIDRSYPLEPLENKPRKQANGNGVQKNGNLTVSRQSVTVKRVARADVNSNLNGGKPVVSYHEEIARETFGPSARQHQDDDEFGIENHVAQYSNGNHRDETRIEEVVDQDMIERNRMMAKLHLMEYDETLKHRVKNDLESEEFPEDFMVDVPDKLPKQSVTKKLSQAEARLKRFKNANAKRGNNVTKSQTIALKKRTDPIFPAKFSPRVVKSPSPETVKTAETSNRARRNVPPSPSKSPDTMPRRASTELKVQDTKSTKRGTPMKGAEPIGNRKAMTTTTTTTTSTTSAASTRKSTDVVDGAILENGLHLRDQTAETKYDNDSPTMKKSDAFVIDFDEQPPKENDAPLPRKPFLRKQSTEKQITPTQSLRTPMSISSTSSGISTQNQTSVYRSKMASRAKTPISTTSYKGSTSNKNGGAAAGGAAATETLVPCKACGRRFAPDRVALHEQICIKTGQKKRKQFDTMMYRVKGTDIEPFVKKGLVKKQMEKSKKPEVKSNWRRKHEDFINAIRSAKQVQAHLAAGGKLSDLPPPPVSDNYDYIQCPHCGRKFNKAAADRHIPKCEHMLHNKPIHSRAPKPKR